MPIEGTCDTNPQINLPPGYSCVYQFLTGNFAGNTGTGNMAVYPAGIVNGNNGMVTFTVTTPCGSTEVVQVNFICVSCGANAGSF